MSNFAYVPNIVNGKGTVENVIVIEQDVLNTGLWGNPADWIQTSYNTRGGVHYGADNQPDGGSALRANYAGIGYTYDQTHDVFYANQPYPSWTISAPAWQWQAPVPYPTGGGNYRWDESTTSWIAI
jgi:hypothetical protein